MTCLGRGHYFGEKSFTSNVIAPRNATIRVPFNCPVDVRVGKVKCDYYPKWVHFRQFLLMKEVPFIRALPRNEQLEMYSKLTRKTFATGERIIREGDDGDQFYILLQGSVSVEDSKNGFLLTLVEGHCFGEMGMFMLLLCECCMYIPCCSYK